MINTETDVYVEHNGKLARFLNQNGVPYRIFIAAPDLDSVREILRHEMPVPALFVARQTPGPSTEPVLDFQI